MTSKLDMRNFKYEDGNSVFFEGQFGRVELIYHAKKMVKDFLDDGEIVNESHFEARLYVGNDAIPTTFGSGITEHSAVINLYQEFAKYRAMEDLGDI